ncbi:GNAT family N-acetyltransferase [Microbacterium sp. bgisy203]|uniref:GNAT family N-acetyltransferase n=1 Tax=Microbacterium sp. bgisy203 TaxID=3413799 RepID=UPI003D764B9D
MPDLTLRPWTSADAAPLLAAATMSPDLDRQFGGALPIDLAAAGRLIATALPFDDVNRNWAIVVDGTPVGNVGLSAIETRHGAAWAHYWLSAPARGNGHAARALAAVAAWAFGEGLHRLELGHRVENPASCAVARRAGFRAEGIEREKLRYGDERFDVETHARLASDPDPGLAPVPFSVEGEPPVESSAALSHTVPPGTLHHVELRTIDLSAAMTSWGWILGELGYEPFQDWPDGRSWMRGDTYLVLERAPRDGDHDRRDAGLSHLAFHAGSRADVDRLWATALAHGWRHLYADRHPFAGGADVYAAFLENDERFKIELVADDERLIGAADTTTTLA